MLKLHYNAEGAIKSITHSQSNMHQRKTIVKKIEENPKVKKTKRKKEEK